MWPRAASVVGSLWLSMVVMQASLSPVLTDTTNGECITYESELKSRPDLTHRVMYKSSPLPPGYIITSMELDASRQRSFYWCELKLQDGEQVKIYRHFGHNTTHLWVEKGCGAWFIITGCLNPSATTSPSDSRVAVSPTTPSGDRTTTSSPNTPQEHRKQLELSDLRHGALLSLISWLSDKSQHNVADKLGAQPNSRMLRSVDEEFEYEFGRQAR